jgi:hypothetical protein
MPPGDVAPNNGLRQLVMMVGWPEINSLYFRDIFCLTMESVYTANTPQSGRL